MSIVWLKRLKKLVNKFFFSWAGLKLEPLTPILRPWEDDKEFRKIIDSIIGRTLVDDQRCHILYNASINTKAVKGDIAEIGVYKGGTAKLLSMVNSMHHSGKTIHLFDTFEGMPETDKEKDLHKKGDFSDVSLEGVKSFLKDCGNIEFHPGFFPETATPVEDKRFSLVHIDVDIYKSIIDCCQFFYDRINKGGIIIFDDYGFLSCPGAKEAVDEFFKDKEEKPLYLPTAQAIVVKL